MRCEVRFASHGHTPCRQPPDPVTRRTVSLPMPRREGQSSLEASAALSPGEMGLTASAFWQETPRVARESSPGNPSTTCPSRRNQTRLPRSVSWLSEIRHLQVGPPDRGRRAGRKCSKRVHDGEPPPCGILSKTRPAAKRRANSAYHRGSACRWAVRRLRNSPQTYWAASPDLEYAE